MPDENLDNVADTESQLESDVSKTSKARSLEELLHPNKGKEDNSNAEDTVSDDEQPTTGEDESGDRSEDTDEEEIDTEEIEEDEEEQVEEEETEEQAATHSKLNKKYPGIFKEFPGLRNKIGREAAFSELFPTVDEARVASKKAEVFDVYETEIQKGNPDAIIGALPNAQIAEKFASQILPSLHRAHPKLFNAAVDPVMRLMLNKVNQDATSAGDKNLGLAAKYISRYLYGKAEIPSLPDTRNNQPDPEKEELKAQLAQTQQEKYVEFESSVTSAVQRTLGKEASSLLDPKNTLSPKMKEVLIKQIIEETDEELRDNPKHMARMRAFAEKAKRSGLGSEHKTRILSAYLASARPVLKTISQRIKTEAFGKRVEKDSTNQDKGRKVIPSSSGRGINPPSKVIPSQFKDVKEFKAKGGQMEDILGG